MVVVTEVLYVATAAQTGGEKEQHQGPNGNILKKYFIKKKTIHGLGEREIQQSAHNSLDKKSNQLVCRCPGGSMGSRHNPLWCVT